MCDRPIKWDGDLIPRRKYRDGMIVEGERGWPADRPCRLGAVSTVARRVHGVPPKLGGQENVAVLPAFREAERIGQIPHRGE